MSKSIDVTAEEAKKQIKNFTTVGELRAYTKGDSRKSVNDTLEAQVDKIKNSKKSKPDKVKEEKEEKKKATTPSR